MAHLVVAARGTSNLEEWCARLPLRRGVAIPQQRHTSAVAEARHTGWFAGVDGLWSRTVPLGVRTADCVPLFFFDEATRLRALVHAGRAGIGDGIVESCTETLRSLGAHLPTMRVHAGPHIGPCCYRFPRGSSALETVVREIRWAREAKGSVVSVDLGQEVAQRLRCLGVERVNTDTRCTCCHPLRLPSHRREGTSRRRVLLGLLCGKESLMSVDPELVSILACPETKEPVELAPQAMVDALNALIAKGVVKNRGGEPVTEPIDGGLVREDRRFLYPIREDIPIMLIEEAIELPPLGL